MWFVFLAPLVHDELLLNLLIQDTNLQKIKHRLEYRAQYINANQTILGTQTTFNKTPQEVLQQLQTETTQGIKIDDYHTVAKRLQNKGWNKYQHNTTGHLHRLQLQIILRKNK